MISLQSWVSVCLVALAVKEMKVCNASKTVISLPKQTVTAGSTVEFKSPNRTSVKYSWCVFGIFDPMKPILPNPSFLNVLNGKGQNKVGYGNFYDRRVSFFGDLNIGKAWFRISDVQVKDTNTYQSSCKKGYYMIYLLLELKVLPAADKWEPLGCYRDGSDRSLPIHYANVNFNGSPGGFKNMFEKCKKKAEEKGFEYFGIQNKRECWGSPNGQEITYNKNGCQNNCLRIDDGYGSGTSWSNFVYRLKKEWSNCKDGFQYKLLSKQDTCYKCPSYNIKIEKTATKRKC